MAAANNRCSVGRFTFPVLGPGPESKAALAQSGVIGDSRSCWHRGGTLGHRGPLQPVRNPLHGEAVTDRRKGAGDDRHIGASFWQAERTSRQA